MQNHPSARFTSSSSASTAAFRFLSCHPPTLQETTPPRPSSYSISTKQRNRPNDQCRLHAFTVKTCVQVCTLPLVKTTCSSADNFFGTIVSIAIVLIIEAAFALAPNQSNERSTKWLNYNIFYFKKYYNKINKANLVLLKMHMCFQQN